MPDPPSIHEKVVDLKRRLSATPVGQKLQVVGEWADEVSVGGAPSDQAHTALIIRDLCKEFSTFAVEPMRTIVVIHGIRDRGAWMEMVRAQLTDQDTFVQPTDFDWVDAGRFMCGLFVGRIIKRVTDRIRDAHADHGGELIIIAHSFGTYLTSQILLKNPDIRCSKIIFCGAVISKDFEFRHLTQKPLIVNECGDRDIYPILAHGFSVWKMYGDTGVSGVRHSSVRDRFHDCAHSDYLVPEFVEKYWLPFVRNGEIINTEYQVARRSQPWGVSILLYGRTILLFVAFLAVSALAISWHSKPYIGWMGIAVLWLLFLSALAALFCKVWSDVKQFRFPEARE